MSFSNPVLAPVRAFPSPLAGGTGSGSPPALSAEQTPALCVPLGLQGWSSAGKEVLFGQRPWCEATRRGLVAGGVGAPTLPADALAALTASFASPLAPESLVSTRTEV